MRTRILHFVLLSAILAAPLQADGKLAIKGARVVTLKGDVIENGVVLVEDGRIAGVGGAELEVPWDAEVIDASGKVVFPGLVLAHTSESLDRANENVPVTPFLSVLDALDPMSNFYEGAIRAGITTIHVIPGNETVIGGKGMVVKPEGLSVEAMMVKPLSGMKIAVGPKRGTNRMGQLAELRRTFAELRAHIQDEAEKKVIDRIENGKDVEEPKEGETLDPFQVLTRDDLDVKRRDLFDLIQGKMSVFLSCDKAMDVAPAIALAESEGFLAGTVLVIEAECHKAADLIQEKGLSVILPANMVYRERDPLTGEESEVFLPTFFQEKGIPYAFTVASNSNSMIQQSMLLQAANAVRMGAKREDALAAITTMPAKMLGLDGRVGSIEVGKDANLLILSGDPLDSQTWVEEVILEGRRSYSKAGDARLQKLTGDAVDGGK